MQFRQAFGNQPADIVRSSPIKGTRRSESQRLDLWSSPKERSELTMIVDMARNDLGASCVAGSIFSTARKIVRCGDLLHAEQDIFGTLLSDEHRFSVLEQSFPPASVTGAPKSSALQIIRQLEWSPRSIYTGSLGFILDSGYAHFNVAIRTIIMNEAEQYFHTGAGLSLIHALKQNGKRPWTKAEPSESPSLLNSREHKSIATC